MRSRVATVPAALGLAYIRWLYALGAADYTRCPVGRQVSS